MKKILATCSGFEARYVESIDRLFSIAPSDCELLRDVDRSFPDGEVYAELSERVDGAQVIVLQSLSGSREELHTALLALFASVRAFRQYGATEVTVFAPHLPYSREDRQVDGEFRSTTASLVADLLRIAGADRMTTIQSGSVDLLAHAYRPLQLNQLTAVPFFCSAISDLGYIEPILVAPDTGSAGLVSDVAQAMGLDFLVAEKQRLDASSVQVSLRTPSSDLHDRPVVILDDLVCSAGTLDEAIRAIERLQPSSIGAAAAHLRLTDLGKARIEGLLRSGRLSKLIAMDTYPNPLLTGVSMVPFVDACSAQLARVLARPSGAHEPVIEEGLYV